jgi:hypothetical protein
MLSEKLPILLTLTLAALPVWAQVSGEPASSEPQSVLVLEHAPRQHGLIADRQKQFDGSVTSSNWSGYAVTGANGSFTYAAGSWVVPTVTCDSIQHQYSSFWVGIDGYNSSTVEQTGTDSDCDRDKPTYYAWYEFYPAGSVRINTITVEPGNVISAWVSYANSEFTVWIENITTGKVFSVSSAVASAARSSAEWIAEAPSSVGGVLPLANFGTALFGDDSTGEAGTNCATQSGGCAAIGSYSTWEAITMEKRRTIEALPSALSSDGTSFSVAHQ